MSLSKGKTENQVAGILNCEKKGNKSHLVRFGGIVKSGDGDWCYVVSTAAFNEKT